MMESQTFTISLFQSVGDTHPQQTTRTWPQLCAKFAKPQVRQEKDGLLFSPAKYRQPRRLIANVIELSLLVLEVDGAWRCDKCGHQGPLTMFRNRRHDGDRCPACKKRDKKLETSAITQIQFDCDSLAAGVRRAFRSAFALYSTHSHKLVTYSNPLAEPRFRIVLPLTEPVPVGQFLELWHAAVEALTEVPADPQVKDANRIYYTPVKFSDEAPYEYHIEPGQPLDWKKFLTSPPADLPSGSNSNSIEQTTAAREAGAARVGGLPLSSVGPGVLSSAVSSGGIYESHESRHEELCRRIMARGKKNSRGNYDARCLAHGGKGTTALLYNPRTGSVSCNKGCDYFADLLPAEGLDNQHLPSAARVAAWQGLNNDFPSSTKVPLDAKAGEGDHDPARTVSLAKLHVINSLLLAHLFELTSDDETVVRRYWADIYGEDIEWPGTDVKLPVKVCSFPSRRLQLEAVKRLSQEFSLEGVPGFYRVLDRIGPDGEQQRADVAEFGPWRLALDQCRMKPGALLTPYDNGSGYICGIRIHRNIRDKVPFLLTSSGLPGGSKAVAYREVAA